jgi:hypothetical protein
MADHWNNASFVVPLSAEQQVWAMTALKRRESYEGDDDENPTTCIRLKASATWILSR